MRTEHEKVLDLLQELATTNHVELVIRHYSDGSGYKLYVQLEGSMHTYASALVSWDELGEAVYEKGKKAIAKAVAQIEGGGTHA